MEDMISRESNVTPEGASFKLSAPNIRTLSAPYQKRLKQPRIEHFFDEKQKNR